MATGSREVWAKRVAQWKSSGQTAAEFARRHKLGEASLKWWSWKLGASRKKATAISPLTFVEMTAIVPREAIELVVGAIKIRVPAEFDEAALGKVLDVVERRR
jgi:hypothetical protein